MAIINVQQTDVTILKINEEDYISLTDIAKFKTSDPFIVVCNWMRNRNTIEYLGIWETLYNTGFKPIEFDRFRTEAGLNSFTLSPQKWIDTTKINYHIHTDAVKQNLIPLELTPQQISYVYANEADVLNMAMFGITAKEWRDANPEIKGNIRDYASINELICLSNMENLNAVFINENMSQSDRLVKLNQIAIQQMRVLQEVENRKLLK
ncbi:MAG: KilA-N domain-containing protein [Bacteroidales bacterium]|nr:KilA-N domain-containing protein [Bacteroidales bacterium]